MQFQENLKMEQSQHNLKCAIFCMLHEDEMKTKIDNSKQ